MAIQWTKSSIPDHRGSRYESAAFVIVPATPKGGRYVLRDAIKGDELHKGTLTQCQQKAEELLTVLTDPTQGDSPAAPSAAVSSPAPTEDEQGSDPTSSSSPLPNKAANPCDESTPASSSNCTCEAKPEPSSIPDGYKEIPCPDGIPGCEVLHFAPAVKDCTGQPIPAETLAWLHDQSDVPANCPSPLTVPAAEQRTKKAKTVVVKRPAEETAALGIEKGKPDENLSEVPQTIVAGSMQQLPPSGECLRENGDEAKAQQGLAIGNQKANVQKLKKKLKGGIGVEPAPVDAPPPEPEFTPTQIQAIVNELVWKHGSNVAEWLDYPKILADARLHPEQVSESVLEQAHQAAQERQKKDERPHARERRLGSLCVGCCVVEPIGGRKAEILAMNESEIKVATTDGGKQITQGWSTGTMVQILTHEEFHSKKSTIQPDARTMGVVNEGNETQTNEASESEGEAMKVQLVKAVKLLTTWYPTADKFNAKKAAAKLRALPTMMDADPEAKKPEDDAGKTLLAKVLEAHESGVELEVVGDGEAESNGKPTKKKGTAVAKKPAAKPVKAAKASKNGTASSNGHAKPGKKKGDGEVREGSIVHTILSCLQKGPSTKEAVVKVLVKKFPDHKPDTLKNTVSWNIATGLPRKGFKVKKDAEGAFSV